MIQPRLSPLLLIAPGPPLSRFATAISHYFRNSGSYGLTAEQFGNSEEIIKQHYQGRVSSEETKKAEQNMHRAFRWTWKDEVSSQRAGLVPQDIRL